MSALLTPQQFNVLLPPIRPALLRHAARSCGKQNADDLIGNTVLIALQRLDRFDADTGASGLIRWLVAILDNLCLEFWRDKTRRETLLPNTEAVRLADSVPEENFDDLNSELDAKIRAAPLTRRQRECLTLTLSGKTQQEIADQLRLRQPTVAEHIAAARLRVQAADPDSVPPQMLAFFRAVCQVTIYRRPTRWGASLGRERLRRLR